MADQQAIVAVLAGGLGGRLGGAKPSVALGRRPLVAYPLEAAADAGLEAIVVAKRSTILPRLDAEVVYEPEEPRHPLCGILAGLRFASARSPMPAVVTLACDMPFLTASLLAWLAGRDGAVMAQLDGQAQPLLARCPVEGLPLLARALAEGRSLRSAFGVLAPSIIAERELSRFGDPMRLCFNVNDRGDLRTAREWLASGEV
jgi:molybdopterin-guanine dinucleotide biosynthesis protein A